MSKQLLYKSIIDGWRVGSASNVSNTSKVTVDDNETGLMETVLPRDIYVPTASALLTSPISLFTSDDDLSAISPTPLEALPTLLHALRCRYTQGKDSTLVGDNALLYHKGTSADQTHLAYARRLTAAVKASPGIPQQVTILGNGNSFDLLESLATSMSSQMGGMPLLPAALNAIKPFCVTSKGEALSIISVEMHPASSAARLKVTFEDYSALDCLHDGAGMGIFGYLIHGCSRDEKDSCYFPTSTSHTNYPDNLSSADVEGCRLGNLQYRRALDALGVDQKSQVAILGRVSAALQLSQAEFDAEGNVAQLSAIKNTARALRVDFEQLKELLPTKQHAFALSCYLFKATIVGLLRRINSALNSTGAALSTAAINLCLMPSTNHIEEVPRRLLVETLHEDLAQCLFRTSEHEIMQWQRSGFSVPLSLQHLFDSIDNYSLLKVLRGSGGVLSALSASNEELAAMLSRVSKHKSCEVDMQSLSITIKHSNDREITYKRINSGGYPTLASSGMERLKDYVLSGADADSQEAMLLLDQQGPMRPNTVLCNLDSLKAFAATSLANPSLMHWWAFDLSPVGGLFDGFAMEHAIVENRIRPFTMLRQQLPKRFLPCTHAFVAKEFDSLCPRADRANTDVHSKAESIFTAKGLHYLVAKDSLLVEARSIMQLYAIQDEQVRIDATTIQALARAKLASDRLAKRIITLQEAIGLVVKRLDTDDSKYRHELNNQDLFKSELLDLQEIEQGSRAAIRDACWVGWVALQTEEQVAVEEVIERQVAKRIKEDEIHFKSVVRQREARALDDLSSRVQERILQQGARLDNLVAAKNMQLQGSRRHLETSKRVHERRMGLLISDEDRKTEVQQSIINKNFVSTSVAHVRAAKSAKLRDDMWVRHERDRLARMELSRARDAIADKMREKFVMEGIEAVVAKRVSKEVTERNRKVREAEEALMRREREERERELREVERKQTAQSFRKIKSAEQVQQQRDAEKRVEQYRQWTIQERERQAIIRLQKEEQNQHKKLTSALLQAHSMVANPQMFDLNGNVRTNRSHSKHQDPGFSLADGSTSYAKLLPNASIDSVVAFHQKRSPTPYSKSKRAFSPDSQYSL